MTPPTRLLLAGPLALGAVVLAAGAASAHVTVTPSSAAPGTSTELTFRVPNEEATADTNRVDVLIPTQHPIAQLLVAPVPGWTATTKTVKLAKPLVTDDGKFTSVVSEVTWSGGRIAPGQYQDFSVSVDPLPDSPTTLTFKTLQTYSNGDVVRWIDVQQPGQDEPEHPAPTLTITQDAGTATDTSDSGDSGDSGDMAGMSGMSGTDDTASSATHDSGSSAGWPGVVSIVAVVLALLGLWVALGTRRRPSA